MIIVKIIFSNATWHKQALGRKVEGEGEQRKVEVLPRRTIFSCFNIIYDFLEESSNKLIIFTL